MNHTTRLAIALAALALASACGGKKSSSTDVPAGTHHHYIVDSVTIPTSTTQGNDVGLDLDGDGAVDNQFASIFSALVQASGSGSFDFQGGMDASIATGATLLLADVQAGALTSSSNVGFATYRGANPTPSPCTNASDTVCRHHLDGNGSFDVDPASPTDAVVAGKIAAGTFDTTVPGDLLLTFDFLGAPIETRLVSARAKLTGITATTLGPSILAGAVPGTDVQTKVLPAIQVQIATLINRDCINPMPPNCGCLASSTGETLLGLFDDNSDCTVPLAELSGNSLISTLLVPDLDTDGDGTNDAISIGVGFTAVGATYTQP